MDLGPLVPVIARNAKVAIELAGERGIKRKRRRKELRKSRILCHGRTWNKIRDAYNDYDNPSHMCGPFPDR